MILIFIKYSDVSIPSRLSWDVKEKAWLGQLIGQASDRAKPSPFAFKDVEELILAMRLERVAHLPRNDLC